MPNYPKPLQRPVTDYAQYKLGVLGRARCAQCPLLTQPGPVLGMNIGEPHPLLLVGEAPGGDEVSALNPENFRPFVGGSGRLLNVILHQAGIERKGVPITNCVQCRPPGNRTPTDTETFMCGQFLVEEIERTPRNCIIALGDTALNVLTGKKGITNYRGVPLEGFGGRKVFPTWHPAFIAQAQYNWPFMVHDLIRARSQGEFPEIRREPFEVDRNPSFPSDFEAVEVQARERGEFTFDLETTGLSPTQDHVVYLGVVAETNKAKVFHWNQKVKELLQRVFDDPKVEIIGQNILYFDYPFLIPKGLRIPWNRTFDTMVAFHLCNASYGQTTVREQQTGTQARGMEKDLTMIASCHTDMEYWKSKGNYETDLLGVCGKDVIATDRSALSPTGLKAELRYLDMEDLYYKHVVPVHPILYGMTQAGIKINEEKACAWSYLLSKASDQLEVEIRKDLNEPFLDLESPKQLMDLLYNKLHLPVQYTREGRPTSNVDALDSLSRLAPQNAVLARIIDIRKMRKLQQTYVDPAIRAGWVHPSFGVSKASTGRFNCWNPNAQNVPEDMREFWVADDKDSVLLAADWSQIEWRLSMVLSGDPKGLELLASGVDNHKAVAAEALRKPYEEVTTDERQSAKLIVYGLGYGRGADSLSKSPLSQTGGTDRHQILLPIEFVNSFISNFFLRFSAFKRWRDENVNFVMRNNYLANPFKRRRWWYTQAVTEVYNFPQQSTAADMMYDALIALSEGLPDGASLRLTVHDEVVLNVHLDVLKKTYYHVLQCMERPWPQIVEASRNPLIVKKYYPDGWYCPADIHVGYNWKQSHSKDPEDHRIRTELEKRFDLKKPERT